METPNTQKFSQPESQSSTLCDQTITSSAPVDQAPSLQKPEDQNCDKVLNRFGAEHDNSTLSEGPAQLKTPVFVKQSAKKHVQPLSLDAQARLESAEGQNLKRLGFDVERILSHVLEQQSTTKQEEYDSEVVRFDFAEPITALESRGKRKLCSEVEPPRPTKRTTISNHLLSTTGPFYPFDEQNALKELAKSLGFTDAEIKQQLAYQPKLCTQPGSTPLMFVKFSPLVQRMVEASSQDMLDVVGEFAAVSETLVGQEPAGRNVWPMVKFLINKLYTLEGLGLDQVPPSGYFKRMHAAQHLDYFGSQAREFRVLIKSASLAFLSEGYRKYIDVVVGDDHDDLCTKLDVFIRKVHPNYAGNFWARAYYLLRCGYSAEILRHVAENRCRLLKRDMFLLNRLEALLADPNASISDEEQQAIFKEIRHLERVSTGDPNPFHLALLKLVGGVDPKSEGLPDVGTTFEDALWFQLYLVREPIKERNTPNEEVSEASTSTLDISDEAYDPNQDLQLLTASSILPSPSTDGWSLESLQKVVMAVGPSHPHFLHSLLFTGQFEAAVNCLSQVSICDGLHLAVVLEHYGLLRTSKKPKFSLLGQIYSFRLEKSHVVGEIEFDALLVSALANVAASDAALALPYMLLLNKFSSPAYPEMCALLLERLVLDTRQYKALLGLGMGVEQVEIGLIESSKRLLPTSDFDGFFRKICRRAVLSELLANDLYAAEGVLALTKDYVACIQIINKQLTDVLFPISLALNLELKDELLTAIEVQTSGLRERLVHHLHSIESSETCPIQIATSAILEMLDFCNYRLQENDSEGRIVLQNMYIIPASSSPEDLAQKLAQLLGFNTWVKRCIPTIYPHVLQFIKKLVGFPLFISVEPVDLDLVTRARSIYALVSADLKHQLIPESATASIQSETFFIQYGL